MCIVVIFGGFVISIFVYFFFNFDFDECKVFFYLENIVVEGRVRIVIKGSVEYVFELILWRIIFLKRWMEIICIVWFK